MRAELDTSRLAAAAKRAALCQNDIANICEVERSTVGRWFSGETYPSRLNLAALASAVGVKARDLVKLPDESEDF